MESWVFWIITTVAGLAIGVIGYFLKRTINQVDKQDEYIRKLEREGISDAELKKSIVELKRDIRQIREDYVSREIHKKDFDECRKEIKEIRQDYLIKNDFIREFSKIDQKLDRMMDIIIEKSREWRDK